MSIVRICIAALGALTVKRRRPTAVPPTVVSPGSILILSLAFALGGCGGGGSDSSGSVSAVGVTSASTNATEVTAVNRGATPFIAFIDLTEVDLGAVSRIEYVIRPKPGTFSKPVSVSFGTAYLVREGYGIPAAKFARIPVFGLYASYSNLVDVTLRFADGSIRPLPAVTISTGSYTGSSTRYMSPIVHVARSASDNLGFSFFYMKNAIGTPVIVDTDGSVRWLGSPSVVNWSSAWYKNGFVLGHIGPAITRYELDGRISTSYLTNPDYRDFHHNIDIGPIGLLGEFDQPLNTESTIAEFDQGGAVWKEWDMARIISDYMRANGDDPALFVIPTADWFHSNAVAYDSRDKSLIVSSRENFLIKIDYATGRIIWIFGDPTKYWYTFPSLRAKALTLNSGLYPIGQHAVSVTPQGYLQVFNDGAQSSNQPATAPRGSSRSYSSVSTYLIDEASHTATDIAEFDYGKSILSPFCSSAYTETDGRMLVNYAAAASSATPTAIGSGARLVGVSPTKGVSFDFEYPTYFCATSFYANVVHLESLEFD